MGNGLSRQREIDDLIVHIKGLVRAREQLRAAGASDRELQRRSAEISRLHSHLAHRVRGALRGEGAHDAGSTK